MSQIKKIGVLTGGGDCPGLNAVIRAVVKTAIEKDGFIGVFTGGLTATSGGITAAVLFGIIATLISKPKIK